MSMSIGSFRRMFVWRQTLYYKKGGQCSFYCRLLLKSRFLLDLSYKKRVVFDTTTDCWEVQEMKANVGFDIKEDGLEVEPVYQQDGDDAEIINYKLRQSDDHQRSENCGGGCHRLKCRNCQKFQNVQQRNGIGENISPQYMQKNLLWKNY